MIGDIGPIVSAVNGRWEYHPGYKMCLKALVHNVFLCMVMLFVLF